MRKVVILILIASIATWFSGCKSKYFEVDSQILQEKIFNPTTVKFDGLESSTVLYLDHSTCVIDANKNSSVFKALRPNLGQYSDTLVLIKGREFDTIPLNRQENRIAEVLERISQDIPFADIRSTIFNICNGNRQAILITDCEAHGNNNRFLDLEAYMSEPFKNWIKRGHSIYIVVEPYMEKYQGKDWAKNRFYFFFSNDRMQAPISHNMLSQIENILQNGECKLYKLTNSDISVQREGNNMVAEDLTFTVEDMNGFQFVAIDDTWDDIREYVMKLDKYGELMPDEEPVPLLKNLIFTDGNNFSIDNVEIIATNITARYLALEDSSITSNDINMSEGFALDKNALQNNKLDVILTEKIFEFLTDEYGGNLIRLDFVVTNTKLKDYYDGIFKWQSLHQNDTAICVSKSIENVLSDIEIVPTNKERNIIHTVFVKTEAYK